MRLLVLALVIAVGLPVAQAEVVPGSNIDAVPEAKRISAVLRQPENQLDFARIKLTIDKMVDRTVNVDAGLKQIDGIVAKVRAMLGSNPSSNEKVQALKTYLYKKGAWNDYQAFNYDFDDPLAKKQSATSF